MSNIFKIMEDFSNRIKQYDLLKKQEEKIYKKTILQYLGVTEGSENILGINDFLEYDKLHIQIPEKGFEKIDFTPFNILGVFFQKTEYISDVFIYGVNEIKDTGRVVYSNPIKILQYYKINENSINFKHIKT